VIRQSWIDGSRWRRTGLRPARGDTRDTPRLGVTRQTKSDGSLLGIKDAEVSPEKAMSHDDEEMAARAMRELARSIVHDGIDSDHLDAYMRELLSARLVELPALCRLEAALVARSFAGLSARETALRLYERARHLEETASPAATSQPARARPEIARASEAFATGPAFIGCVVFTILGVAILLGWPHLVPSRPMIGGDDRFLRFAAAITCVLTGTIYACEGVRVAWRNSRSGRGPCS
jgi:hypothetical protein